MTDAHRPTTALIGCGRWGRNIARALADLRALRVIADPAAEAVRPFAAEVGAEVVATLEEVWSKAEVDSVAIAAPAADHARLVQIALAAGKHVFVEKPLALTIEDAQACAVAARRAGRHLMVGHLLQYHPAFVRLLELIDEGAIGAVRHLTSHRLNPGAIRTEENALWSLAPHDFSMILRLTGCQPNRLESTATRIVQPLTPDQYLVSMEFQGGVTAQVYVSWLSPYKEHRLVVLGETGALLLQDTVTDSRKLLLFRDHVDLSGPTPRYNRSDGEPVAFPHDKPLHAEMSWFLDVVAGRALPRTGPEEAMGVLELLQRADAASRR